MKYKIFGNTDLTVSELGLGCQSLGGGLYYRDDAESIITLHKAFEYGINFYDVSDHHSLGRSEKLIGKAFKNRRDKVVITSKAGLMYSQIGIFALKMRSLARPVSPLFRHLKTSLHFFRASQLRFNYSHEYIIQAVEKSLIRLKTDYLDLFQLYKPSAEIIEQGEFIETLEKLKTQGKIRYYGITCLTVADALLCLKFPNISSIQVAISLIDQEAITKLIPAVKERNLGLIARHPRAIGLFTKNRNDIMGDSSAFSREEFEIRKAKASKFQFLVKDNRSIAQASIQFVLQLDGISVVLPRAVNSDELDENVGSLSAPFLTEDELKKIYYYSQS
jgi:aryl-alcohol dehydrogenase-like predicted oxidoreductase